MEEVVTFEAGYNHVSAMTKDGTLWIWGKNNSNQLGDGTTNNSSKPIQVISADISGYWRVKSSEAYEALKLAKDIGFSCCRRIILTIGKSGASAIKRQIFLRKKTIIVPSDTIDFEGVRRYLKRFLGVSSEKRRERI